MPGRNAPGATFNLQWLITTPGDRPARRNKSNPRANEFQIMKHDHVLTNTWPGKEANHLKQSCFQEPWAGRAPRLTFFSMTPRPYQDVQQSQILSARSLAAFGELFADWWTCAAWTSQGVKPSASGILKPPSFMEHLLLQPWLRREIP